MAYQALDWHSGEIAMHKKVMAPHTDNPTQPFLSPNAANILPASTLLAVGTLDDSGQPWTSLWGGEQGFTRGIGQSIIGVRTTVDCQYDPVATILLGKEADGEVLQVTGEGKMVSALGINLQARRRVKLFGRLAAGALAATEHGAGEIQLVVKVEQSLGNCPKYLNRKVIIPSPPHPELVGTSLPLSHEAAQVIRDADLFFISSSQHGIDMDTNHRGGPVGFVRILSNTDEECSIVYPEYSGNRLYQTLGNLHVTPNAGLVFPDFSTGNVLYITGTTEILVGKEASDVLRRCNLAVKITIQEARFVRGGLAFRAQPGELSPYNPPIRYLHTEQKSLLPESEKTLDVKIIDKKILTPTIARFKFHINDPEKASRWKPGQYVALNFAKEFDIGYSHMRDDDPTSINDDFLRTFTVTSQPGERSHYDEFEITIRKVGSITSQMFRHNPRADMEIGLNGFGGEFFFQQGAGEDVAFVAGGVGITPLLAQAACLDLQRLHVLWTVKAADLGLVTDTFERIPGLATRVALFVTGNIDEKAEAIIKDLEARGTKVESRRLQERDPAAVRQSRKISRWYICTGPGLRTSLLGFLRGEDVIYEDFSY